MKTQAKRFSFNRLSIQLRLQILICALLLASIAVYGFANYYSLRKATILIAGERLNTVAGELSSSLGLSVDFLTKTVKAAAEQNAVTGFISSGGKGFNNETLDILNKLHRDSTWVSVELLDSNLSTVLRSGKSTQIMHVNIKDIIPATMPAGAAAVGNMINVNDSVYFPIVSVVKNEERVAGYVVSWLTFRSSPKVIAQFAKLVGIGADFYVGNVNGSQWTDLLKPLKGVPFTVNTTNELLEFTDGNRKMIANAQIIPHTNWYIVTAFSKETLLKGVTSFLHWIVAIGIVLMAIGALAAWITSRNISRPINQLTTAVTAISQGNYASSVSVEKYKSEELIKLADSFNLMAAEVYRMHEDLENKVTERTLQLKQVNQELEAFSYSVSHDLRAPLRAISGYSAMLKEDYEEKLDNDGNRIVRNIITNAKMMGQLIDDLLAFSRLGKKELIRTTVDMKLLATTVVNELMQQKPENKYRINIAELPPAKADPGMIKQVLINLAGNAIKYSSKKENPEIEIGFKDEDARTIYYIKDNGAGFDMAYAHKLFGVFQRLHSQQEFEGSGVGLALVKRIIDRHNGEIWAESVEDAGATFYFSLPKTMV